MRGVGFRGLGLGGLEKGPTNLRQQVFSRVPIGTNWASGKQASFVLEATGGRYLVPSESRIVAKIRVKSGTLANVNAAGSYAAADQKLEKSVRFANPVSNMFSAGMLSVNGTTVPSVAANPADLSLLQLRTEHTKSGADGPGSAGLLSLFERTCPLPLITTPTQHVYRALADRLMGTRPYTKQAGQSRAWATPNAGLRVPRERVTRESDRRAAMHESDLRIAACAG